MEKLFTEKKSKKPVNTTMLEISDEGKTYEYSGSGSDVYMKAFIEFLESLGYIVEQKYPDTKTLSGHILIKGVEFQISVQNASMHSFNAFTRETYIRKPAHRYIALTKYVTPVVKVHFNVDLDADKLRKKIDESIQYEVTREAEYKAQQDQSKKDMMAIGNHYFSNEIIKKNVRWLHIGRGGVITFKLYRSGEVLLKADGSFISANFIMPEIVTMDELNDFSTKINTLREEFELAVWEILQTEDLPDNLVEFAGKQYNEYFYSETMSTEK